MKTFSSTYGFLLLLSPLSDHTVTPCGETIDKISTLDAKVLVEIQVLGRCEFHAHVALW